MSPAYPDKQIFLLHVISLVKEVIALLNAGHRIVIRILFYLDIPVFHVVGIHLVEDRFEIDLTTCSDFLIILDMDHFELARAVLQVSNRICASFYHPVHIHFKENMIRAHVIQQEIVDQLIFNLTKFECMIVITECDTGSCCFITDRIEIVAIHLESSSVVLLVTGIQG